MMMNLFSLTTSCDLYKAKNNYVEKTEEQSKLYADYGRAKKSPSIENTKTLIDLIYTDFKWIGDDAPPSFLAGTFLIRLFPECGLSGTDLLPQKKGVEPLRNWFLINRDKIIFKEDGSHDWSSPPEMSYKPKVQEGK